MDLDKNWDVIVIGAGTAGVTAAAGAARQGARTLLIEKYGFPGGAATYGFPFLAFFSGAGDQVVRGLPQQLVERICDLGGSPGHCRGGFWRTPERNYQFAVTPYEPEIYKLAALDLLNQAGVTTLFHTTFAGLELDGQKISRINVINKDGAHSFTARFVVDTTGDADCAAAAGCQIRRGDSAGQQQNASLIFTICGIDLPAMLSAMEAQHGFSGWDQWHTRLIRGKKLDTDQPGIIHVAGHLHPWLDERKLTFTVVSVREGCASFNITRTTGIDGSKTTDLVRAEYSERQNMYQLWQALRRNIPGFSSAFISAAAQQVGIRESRNIIGQTVITRSDVVNCREFPDNIARGAYPIDIHDPKGGPTQFVFLNNGGSYGIPYRALLPREIDNLLVAGRPISTTHEAHGTVRIMATAMATGEACGTAAALLAKSGASDVRAIDIELLRAVLKQNNAILDPQDI